MINDTIFSANITEYRNYLQQSHMQYKEPVAILSEAKLLGLLRIHYKNSGNNAILCTTSTGFARFSHPPK